MVSRNITLFQNKHVTGEAFLAHNRLSPSILNCIFLHHILKMKPNLLYQVLNYGRIVEVTTMGGLLLGRPKGGSSHLIEVAAY